MTKNSHLLSLFGIAICVSTLVTNVAFHKLGWDRYSDIQSMSIASAKTIFELPSDDEVKQSAILGVKTVREPEKASQEIAKLSSEKVRPIELILSQEEIDWIRQRNQSYFELYLRSDETAQRDHRWQEANRDPNKHKINATTGYTNYDEDREKVWMDFLIAGHPKTGTTTLVANLAKVAPMKVKDFCAPKPSTIMRYVMDKWRVKFPEIMDGPNQYVPDKRNWLVGSKCPQFIGSPELLSRYTVAHPRMKLIVGIRHPIEWFNSFIKMGHRGNLYKTTKICPHFENIDPISGIPGGIGTDQPKSRELMEVCINECRCGIPICLHRARLHIGLARIGKTPLSSEERNLLAPEDPDGGQQLFDAKVKNPIFLYDQTQMKEDSYWDELAGFLGLNYIPNEHYHGSKGAQSNVTLCTPFYDEFRSRIMAHSYNMSVWLEDYLLPLGLDMSRPDVVIANATSFRELIQTYKMDPCGRLVRSESDGNYVLDPSLLSVNQTTFELHSHVATPCNSKFPKVKEEETPPKKGKRGKPGNRKQQNPSGQEHFSENESSPTGI
mmetsp:Transcript_18490/g.45796  ORF Transcript_18490/g.45796 Transcript_18490/m.45796 type:complete len:552 (-) Transcript_18490:311-1966(-)